MQDTAQPLSLELILATTLDEMQRLLEVLCEETTALKENNIENLENVTENKIRLTELVNKNEKLRIQFLSARSLDPSTPAQWLYNKELTSLWSKIKDVSEKAQKQNQINGLVINGNRRSIQNKIEILSASPPATELVYSSSGENIKQRSSNTIGLV